MKIPTPYFIVFEGIDGSGKTTLSKMLLELLKNEGYDTLWLREPGDSRWGRKIRELAQSEENIPIRDELRYFIEDRKYNVKHHILPALKEKKIVILDRYYFSTACYQGARGLDMAEILETNRQFAPVPNLTIILDVTVDRAMARITGSRDSKVPLFEKEHFLNSVRRNYLKLKGDNIHLLDGNRELDTVFGDLKKIIEISTTPRRFST